MNSHIAILLFPPLLYHLKLFQRILTSLIIFILLSRYRNYPVLLVNSVHCTVYKRNKLGDLFWPFSFRFCLHSCAGSVFLVFVRFLYHSLSIFLVFLFSFVFLVVSFSPLFSFFNSHSVFSFLISRLSFSPFISFSFSHYHFRYSLSSITLVSFFTFSSLFLFLHFSLYLSLSLSLPLCSYCGGNSWPE